MHATPAIILERSLIGRGPCGRAGTYRARRLRPTGRAVAPQLARSLRASSRHRIPTIGVTRTSQAAALPCSAARASNGLRRCHGESGRSLACSREGAKYAKNNEDRASWLGRYVSVGSMLDNRCPGTASTALEAQKHLIGPARRQRQTSPDHRRANQVGNIRHAWSDRRTWQY